LFSTGEDGKGQALAVNPDSSSNGSAKPVSKGSVVRLFGTGQGAVSPPVADGEAAPSELNSRTLAVPTSDSNACLNRQPAVCATIGAAFGEVVFSGLAPYQIGVWRVDIKIPASAPAGPAVPVRVVLNGAPSNIVTLAIQ
jgi:uncharacterized protein (TIGR03437 family)